MELPAPLVLVPILFSVFSNIPGGQKPKLNTFSLGQAGAPNFGGPHFGGPHFWWPPFLVADSVFEPPC